MKILFTGASSFTGFWFVQELKKDHEVIVLFNRSYEEYEDLRQTRVDLAKNGIEVHFDCPFGSKAFLKIASTTPFDFLCHHASVVADYKSPDFDVLQAVNENTYNLKELLEHFCGKKILITGSVFEQREGKGDENLRAVSPYGLSKGLTSDLFQYYCNRYQIPLGKFVIPNPFGPYENPRFTTYLVNCWKKGEKAVVSTPDYVRDNIPVSLLSLVYRDFAEHFSAPFSKINPGFYQESQGAFTKRFANEMKKRLNIPCEYVLQKQTEFQEPKTRINLDRIDPSSYHWEESQSWDTLAEYYQA